MSHPAQNNTLIELHVSDFEVTKTFYGKFGFEPIWEREPEEFKGYLVMKRDNQILCFWPGNNLVEQHEYFKKFPADTPRGYGVELVLMVENLDEAYATAQELQCVVEPMLERPWGLRDFRIADPFGYYLRFTTPHNILESSNAIP